MTYDPTDSSTWSFDQLKHYCIRELMDALFTGGGAEMSRTFHIVFNVITHWQDAQNK